MFVILQTIDVGLPRTIIKFSTMMTLLKMALPVANFCILPPAPPRFRQSPPRVGAGLSDAAGAHHRRLAAGSVPDIISRVMAQWLSERLGHPFVVDNRPGPAAISPTEAVVREPATATRCSWSAPWSAVNPTLYDKLSFDFLRDIVPVAGIIACIMSWS